MTTVAKSKKARPSSQRSLLIGRVQAGEEGVSSPSPFPCGITKATTLLEQWVNDSVVLSHL